ncbi:hypothetical protein BC829DRAFT_3734 [Chytridium lagenaria]|nr:hypothetical protein BC829DRAFT_3734 [Chytridium lagenaria]
MKASILILTVLAAAASANGIPSSSKEKDCANAVRCSDVPSPVCGSDGITYTNDCLRRTAHCDNLSIDVNKVHDGPCQARGASAEFDGDDLFGGEDISPCDAIRCITDFEPVCGSDGETYVNNCFLTIANCKNSSIKMMRAGECGVSDEDL